MRTRFLLAFTACLFACSASAQPDATMDEARTLLAEGSAREAASLLRSLPAAQRSPQAEYLLGLALQDLLQHSPAVASFTRADTSSARVLAARAASFLQLGRSRDALADLRRAYRKDSMDVKIATGYARLLADGGHWPAVRRIYIDLLNADEENALLHARLAQAYVALDSTDEAIAHYERAHRLDLGNVSVALQLTTIYLSQEHLISARRVLERSLDVRRKNARLWQRRADIALREEHFEDAALAYGEAIALGDTSALNLHGLGVSLYLMRDYDHALLTLTASYDRDSVHVMNTFYLGMAHQALGELEQALEKLDETAELMLQDLLADVHVQRARTFDLMERDPAALAAYRLALDLDPTKREVLFHLAAVYDRYYHDKGLALSTYEAFLQAVDEGDLPQMENHARARVQELREAAFFEQGRNP